MDTTLAENFFYFLNWFFRLHPFIIFISLFLLGSFLTGIQILLLHFEQHH